MVVPKRFPPQPPSKAKDMKCGKDDDWVDFIDHRGDMDTAIKMADARSDRYPPTKGRPDDISNDDNKNSGGEASQSKL